MLNPNKNETIERLGDFTLLEREWFAQGEEFSRRNEALWTGLGAAKTDPDEMEAIAVAKLARG